MSFLRCRTFTSGFFSCCRSFMHSFTLPPHLRPSTNSMVRADSMSCGSRASNTFFPLRVFGFLQLKFANYKNEYYSHIIPTYLILKRDILIDICYFNAVFNNSQDARVASYNYCQLNASHAVKLAALSAVYHCF